MPRRPPLILAAALFAAGCSSSSSTPRPSATGPVAVPVPTASAAEIVSACRSLLAAVPDHLDDGVRRRPVTGDPTRTAAWGDPAITLRCGVARATTGIGPITIDTLSFLTTTVESTTVWTTTDRAVNVSIDVPKSYREQVYDVTPLVSPIAKALPAAGSAPGA